MTIQFVQHGTNKTVAVYINSALAVSGGTWIGPEPVPTKLLLVEPARPAVHGPSDPPYGGG